MLFEFVSQEKQKKESENESKVEEEKKKADEELIGSRTENWYTDIPG